MRLVCYTIELKRIIKLDAISLSRLLLPILLMMVWTASASVCPNVPLVDRQSVAPSGCNTASGSVEIFMQGNESDYSYQWSPDNGSPVGTIGNHRNNLPAGIYRLLITDLRNPDCQLEHFVAVKNSDGPRVLFPLTTPSNCNANDGTANINPPNFNYQWSDGGSGSQRTNLAVGDYQVTASDPAAPGCNNYLTVTVRELNPLSASITINQQPQCGQSNGSATINVSGGSGNYQYSWGGGPTNNNLPAGVQTVQVTDLNSGCTRSITFTMTTSFAGGRINIPNPSTSVSCAGNSDGFIDFNYSLDPGFIKPEAIQLIDNNGNPVNNGSLPPGNYCIQLRDANGCLADTKCFEVFAPQPISLQPVVTNQDCNQLGAIAIQSSGGTGALQFDWLDLPGTNDPKDRQNLTAGSYNLVVVDGANCSAQLNNIIVENNCIVVACDTPRVENLHITPATCGNADGSVIIEMVGNEQDFSYTWDPNVGTGGSNTRNNLPGGSYALVITRFTAPDCPIRVKVLVPQTGALDLAVQLNQNPTCNSTNGNVTINVANGSGNYTFNWSDGGNGGTRADLAAGAYTVTVLDNSTNCSGVISFDLTDQSSVGVDVTTPPAVAVSCAGANDANITISVTPRPGFVGPAQIRIEDSAGNQYTNGNLGVGSYCVIVNDALGCFAGQSCFEVIAPPAINIIPVVSNPTCANDGSIQLQLSGGTPPYTFDWTDLPGSNDPQDRFNLGDGVFEVSVIDSRSCVQTLSGITLTRDCAGTSCDTPSIVGVQIRESFCGGSDGRIAIDMLGPESDYNFVWSNASTGAILNQVMAGVYTVVISRVNDPSCQVTESFIVNNLDGPQAQIQNQTSANCNNADGSAELSPANFTYSWCNGATGSAQNNLPPGKCFVTVTDPATACQSFLLVEIGSVNPLTADFTVNNLPDCDAANGSVTIRLFGGSGSNTFRWSDGGVGRTRTDLRAGLYTVRIDDANLPGCETVLVFTLTEQVSSRASIRFDNQNAVFSISCAGASDGFAGFQQELEPGFIQPVQTIIVDVNGQEQTNGQLGPGQYCIQVKDGNGCLAGEGCFEIVEPDPLQLGLAITDQDCNRLGEIKLNISGGTVPYSVDWADLPGGGNPLDRADLLAGNYSLTLTDANGCVLISNGIVLENDCGAVCQPAVVQSVATQSSSCEESNGSISLFLATSGVNYDFTWSPNVSNSPMANNLSAGVYEVTISQQGNPACAVTETILIENADGPKAEVISMTPASCRQPNGTAVISPVIYAYEWCDGGTGFNRLDLPAGDCIVTITDLGSGCQNFLKVTIDEINLLQTQVITNRLPDCGAANGSVGITVVGGSTSYTYSWSDNGSGSSSRSDLAAGTYNVTVTDNGSNACQTVVNFTLNNQVNAAALVSLANGTDTISVSCPGQADARINYSVTPEAGFIQPISEQIEDAAGNVFTNGNLPPGNYCIVVRDGNNCTAGSACFVVVPADQLVVNLDVKPFDCALAGSIRTSVSGGTPPYLFDWADLPGTNDSADRDDLLAGTYQLTISDQNNCTLELANIMVADSCGQCPVTDTSRIQLMTRAIEQVCVDIEDCMDANNLSFSLLAGGGQTGSSVYGSWTLDAGGCLTYRSNDLEGTGVDFICVVTDDGSIQDTTCYFVDIENMIPANPGIDTIYISSPENGSVDTCLTTAALPGVFESSSIYYAPLNGTGTLGIAANDSCLTFTSLGTQTGNFVDTMGVILCDADLVCDTFIIIVSIVPENCDILPDDQLALTGDDCDAGVAVCLDIPLRDIVDYAITIDGLPYGNTFMGCNVDTFFAYQLGAFLLLAPDGPYVLDEWTANGNSFSLDEFNELQELVDSMNVWDPLGNWRLQGSLLIGGTSVADYGPANIRQAITQVSASPTLDPIPVPLGTQVMVDTGSHILVLNEINTGCLDTLLLELSCNECPDIYDGGFQLSVDDCMDNAVMCFDIGPMNITNYEITDNGDPYEGLIIPCDYDTLFQYPAGQILAAGVYRLDSWSVNGDTLRINLFSSIQELVDAMNDFDPTGDWQIVGGNTISGGDPGNEYGALVVSQGGNIILEVEVRLIPILLAAGIELAVGSHEVILRDTTTGCIDIFDVEVSCDGGGFADTIIQIPVGTLDTFCLDVSGLDDIFTIGNLCPQLSGNNANEVEILLDEGCIVFSGDAIGRDTFCYRVCDVNNVCDTTLILVDVVAESDTVRLTVEIDRTDTYCFDTMQFSSPIDTIYNYCPQSSGVFVDFFLEEDSLCVSYTGLDFGQDTSCWVICDQSGMCDTTIIIVETIDPMVDPPVAIDDDTMTIKNTPLVIDVTNNDELNGPLTDIGIVEMPILGMVVVNPDGTLTYVPPMEICNEADSFSYFIETPGGRDTATVFIYIQCDVITVFNGFSPNNDGTNDTFKIRGIENFPNNTVQIFNRWGNRVFLQKGYENATGWDGTWQGKDLPDGTYFYVIEDGEGNRFDGYMILQR